MSSLDSLRRDVQRHQDEIARLQDKKAGETRRVADYSKKAADAAQSATRSSSMSSAASKFRDAQRYGQDQQRAISKVADLEKQIASQHNRLAAAQARLARAEADEAKKQHRSIASTFREQQRQGGLIAQARDRQEALDERLRQLETLPERIVVLFLAANPLDADQLRLDEEVRAITDNIRKSKHRDAVKLESCWAVRPQDVLQAINEHQPRIVHFSGHGTKSDEIVFQDDAGQSKRVTKEAIVQLMMACSGGIRLVFFNTCFSQGQAEAVVSKVDAAIGMTTSINDEVARVFSAQFYSAIGFGLSVAVAFEQAKALVMMQGLGEHETPKLFVAPDTLATDLVLVAPPGDADAAPAATSGDS
jgi:hypothetical protein